SCAIDRFNAIATGRSDACNAPRHQRRTHMNPKRRAPKAPKHNAVVKDSIATYDEFKEFEGRKYTGMKIGRSHKWYYDKGEWKETKITPDLWQISYAVTKRRAGRAPE